jgi:hypothetical protein
MAGYPAGYRILQIAGLSGQISGQSINRDHDNLLDFHQTLKLFLATKSFPLFKFVKDYINKSALVKLPACYILLLICMLIRP